MSSAACNRKPAHQCLKQGDIFLCDKKSSRHKACQFFFIFPIIFQDDGPVSWTCWSNSCQEEREKDGRNRVMAGTQFLFFVLEKHTIPQSARQQVGVYLSLVRTLLWHAHLVSRGAWRVVSLLWDGETGEKGLGMRSGWVHQEFPLQKFHRGGISTKLKLRSLTLSGIHPLIDQVYPSCCGKQALICCLRCFPATAF